MTDFQIKDTWDVCIGIDVATSDNCRRALEKSTGRLLGWPPPSFNEADRIGDVVDDMTSAVVRSRDG